MSCWLLRELAAWLPSETLKISSYFCRVWSGNQIEQARVENAIAVPTGFHKTFDPLPSLSFFFLYLSGMQIFWLIFSSCHRVSQENDLAEWPLPLFLYLSRFFFLLNFHHIIHIIVWCLSWVRKKGKNFHPLKRKKKKEKGTKSDKCELVLSIYIGISEQLVAAEI